MTAVAPAASTARRRMARRTDHRPAVRLHRHPDQRAEGLGQHLTIDWEFTDVGETLPHGAVNGALIHPPTRPTAAADLTFTLTKPQLLGLLAGRAASTASRPTATSVSSNASSP